MAKGKSTFRWDVFLSHSSSQKPRVRAIVHQWRELGLSVFFDEDTIQPGEDIIAALDRGCEKSRHTVLMITPESMASGWVDSEIKRVMYLDPAAWQRRLIPVLLETVTESDIPLSVRRLSRTNLTDPTTWREQYHSLLKSLGITAKPLPDLPLIETDGVGLAALVLEKPVLEAGAMPPDSRYYIERQVERTILEIFGNPGSTVTIKGYRQSGKSSLLARLHARAIQSGRACCILDFQEMEVEEFMATSDFFPALAQHIALGLHLDVDPGEGWKPKLGAKKNLTNFLEDQVLARLDRPLLLFDEADLTFPYRAVREALFSTLRSWHNKRATDLKGMTWRKLGLVVAHSTEPSLWIKDLSQSPFNVAHEFLADDFTEDEVAELDVKYGRKLQGKADLKGLMDDLVGGYPYLVRRALYTMATRPCSFAVLKSLATEEDGPFASHLGHLLNILYNDDQLLTAIRKILKYGKCDEEVLFPRLWSVGLIRGETRHKVWLRYKIYDDYFRKKLL